MSLAHLIAFSAEDIAETQMQNLPTAEDCSSTPAVVCVQPESGWTASRVPSYHHGRFSDCSQSLAHNNLSYNIPPGNFLLNFNKPSLLKRLLHYQILKFNSMTETQSTL